MAPVSNIMTGSFSTLNRSLIVPLEQVLMYKDTDQSVTVSNFTTAVIWISVGVIKK